MNRPPLVVYACNVKEVVMATLIVDKTFCAKSGDCVALCPSVFEIGPDGYARVKAGANTSLHCVETAINNCPCGAIYWV